MTTRWFQSDDDIAQEIIARVGKTIVLGLPLGAGKACHIANALYRQACEDSSLKLTILTALTLEAPVLTNLPAQRFVAPIADSMFGQYPGLDYAQALRRNELPDNVQVKEFFFSPGKWLGSATAQQQYISVNYSLAIDALLQAGMNVIAQLVAIEQHDQPDSDISLSCNPDITVDILHRRAQLAAPLLMVGQVNNNLPFMEGDARRPASDFDLMLAAEAYEFPLFKIPLEPVAAVDHAIGIQVAAMVQDGGTLQIGIGAIGDAICHALVLRHEQPERFTACLRQLQPTTFSTEEPSEPFTEGLYACTEMLVDGLLTLLTKGILRREVDGALLHAAFFIGSPTFHQALHDMPSELRKKIAMMPVSFTNTLRSPANPDESPEIKRQQRRNGRFINSAMMVTLQGAAVSDGLADGRVVSGVGGQHDFVTQAFALPGGRSVITLPATRQQGHEVRSNIVWNYAHTTIPRHLRDIVVTEYGVADLRHQSDDEVIKRLLAITDSRFQDELLKQAKDAGKVAADYQLPDAQRNNSPARVRQFGKSFSQELPFFPLGTNFTPVEQDISVVLDYLGPRASSKRELVKLVWRGFGNPRTQDEAQREEALLQRLQLAKPKQLRSYFRDHFFRLLLKGARRSS